MLTRNIVWDIIHSGTCAKFLADIEIRDINSLQLWSSREYQQRLNIHRTAKSIFENPGQAFIAMWFKDYIISEEAFSFLGNLALIDSICIKELNKNVTHYLFKDMDSRDGMSYITNRVSDMISNIKISKSETTLDHQQQMHLNKDYGITVVNGTSLESVFEFKLNSNILWTTLLKDDRSWAGYKDIFMETEDEFVFFTE